MKYHFAVALTSLLAICSITTQAADDSQSEMSTAAGVETNADLAAFFAEYDEQELSFSPVAKAWRAIRDADYGKWHDPGDAAAAARYERSLAALAEMETQFNPATLSDADRLSYRLFQAQAAKEQNAFQFYRNAYLFDQMNGAQSAIPAFLINMHRVDDKAQAEAYISRLNGIGPFFDTLVTQAAQRANDGIIAPDWVFPPVISDATNVISGAPFEDGPDSPLYADLKEKVNALDIPATEKAELITSGAKALQESVQPAYLKLIAEMQRQQEMAPEGDGVWRFKDGADYYAERLNYYTTTDLSPADIHQIGLDNVARIQGEMRKIMKQVGFDGSLQDFFNYVRTQDRFFYTSRDAYLADVAADLAAMELALPAYFNTLPQASLTVKSVEAFREKSAGKAFYQSPAPDGSRPGTYYVNLYDLRSMSKTELEALAYHEGLPGHHLQRTIQTELGDVPAFRKFGSVTAYSEGWGLYAEELAKDMGFYQDPYSDFGRLGMELWRACRLVVDTGIHDLRWSREKAIAYLTENTPNPEADIRRAIERYIVYPGQATAYMIGKLKIQELRARAQNALGSQFSMGAFHDVILRSGPVPLDVMEERVNEWIADQQARDA